MTSQLRGTGVVLATPFIADGQVDTKALANIVNYVINGGVEFIVVLGTTSEVPTLTEEKKKIMCSTIIEVNKGRLPLVLGTGGNNARDVIDGIEAADLTHLVAILSAIPYYGKSSQNGLYAHFATVATEAPLPIILYNVPGYTGVSPTVETVLCLANDFENIMAIREASDSLQPDINIFENISANFTFLSGDDATTLPSVCMGGSGAISVIGIAYPKESSEMVRLGLQSKTVEVNELHYALVPKMVAAFKESNPTGIKAILAAKGLCQPYVRLPLAEAPEALKEEVKRIEI